MSILTPVPPSVPWPARAFFHLPVIGWMARDVAFGSADNLWYALVIALTVLILSVATWGLPALVMVALAFVPVMFTFLVVIARP